MLGRAAALLVRLYQLTLGRSMGACCHFTPSCSEYAIEAFRMNGLLFGGAQTAWRLLRCGPWSKRQVDFPMPLRFAHPVRDLYGRMRVRGA